MFKWYSTFQKPCEVNWTCQFTHPELVAGAVKVRLARSSSLNLASEPMLSSMKCPLPTLLRHMPPPATSFLETIQNFPKTGPFFVHFWQRRNRPRRCCIASHRPCLEWSFRDKWVASCPWKDGQKSSKIIKIIKNLSDPNSRYFETQNPRQNESYYLSSLISAGTQGKNISKKIRSSKEIGCRAQGLSESGEVWGIYFPNSDSLRLFISSSVQKSSLYTAVDMDSRWWFKILLALYIDSLKRFGHCSRG